MNSTNVRRIGAIAVLCAGMLASAGSATAGPASPEGRLPIPNVPNTPDTAKQPGWSIETHPSIPRNAVVVGSDGRVMAALPPDGGCKNKWWFTRMKATTPRIGRVGAPAPTTTTTLEGCPFRSATRGV